MENYGNNRKTVFSGFGRGAVPTMHLLADGGGRARKIADEFELLNIPYTRKDGVLKHTHILRVSSSCPSEKALAMARLCLPPCLPALGMGSHQPHKAASIERQCFA